MLGKEKWQKKEDTWQISTHINQKRHVANAACMISISTRVVTILPRFFSHNLCFKKTPTKFSLKKKKKTAKKVIFQNIMSVAYHVSSGCSPDHRLPPSNFLFIYFISDFFIFYFLKKPFTKFTILFFNFFLVQ